MKQKIVYYVLFIFLFVLTSYSTTTFSKYTQDINKQLTLNVSQPNYTISFNKNSTTATGSKESVSCVYGTNCVLGQNTFTNNGYTFAGWNTKADGSGTTYTTSVLNLTAINGNTVTLFAIWNADAYSISYDLKGGSVSSNPTTYNIETPTFSLNNPTRSGYTFAGWTGSNGSTPQNTVTITKGSTGDKSYVANWNKSASSLTITLSQATYTYDKTAKTPTVTVKDGSTTLVEGVDYDVTYSNNINAGTANVTITMKNTENANHDATYVGSTTKNFTINKKTVTVTAENKTMNYGDNAPTYTSTISGVISGDTAYTGSVSYTVKNSGNTTVTIGTTSPVGTYSVIPGGLTANSNYTITYTAGTLTISKVTPTINLTAKENLTYNGSSQAANNATVTLKNNESYAGTITYTYYSNSSCTTKVTTSNSGASATGGVPKNAGNWYVQATTAAFGNYSAGASSCVAHTINKKSVTVTADNKSRTYGDTATQTYSYSVSGAVGSESAVSGTATYTVKNSGGTAVTVNSSLAAGTYTITPSGLTAGENYTITYANGTLTVNKATPTISLSAKTGMVYNGSSQAANAATVTLKNSESYTGTITYTYYSDSSCSTQVTTSNSGASTTGGVPKNAGNWYVKATTAAFGNYNAGASSCVAHTISKKTVTVTAENKSRTYGDTATQTYSYTLSGAIGSETAVSGTASYTVKNSGGTTLIVNQILPQGTYTIIPSGLTAAANYTITYVNGTLTVNKATPTISLTAKTGMTYNGLAKSSNAATVTLKNGESYSETITYTYYSNSACTTQVTTSNSGAASAGGMPVYAGNWYVKATTAAFGNYNAGASSCVAHTIAKATPVITLSDPHIELSEYYSTTFNETANVAGIFTNTSQNTGIATVSPVTSSDVIAANTPQTIQLNRIGSGQTNIIVTFTPADTRNYNTITTTSIAKKVISVNFQNLVRVYIKKDSNPWNGHNVSSVRLIRTSDNWYTDIDFTGIYFKNLYGLSTGTYNIISDGVNTGKSFTITETDGVINDVNTSVDHFTLTVNPGTCSRTTGSGVYLSNQTANISAVPAQGYHFTSWTVSSGGNSPASATSDTTTVSTSKTTTLTANCVKNPQYKLTLLYNHTQDKDFEYTGDNVPQEYIIPETLIYKFEAWGAQGGAAVTDGSVHSTLNGGEGAYTSGSILLQQGTAVHVFVGQRPSSISGGKKNNPGGWNGGGTGSWDQKDNDSSGGGGGATDFRIFPQDTFPSAEMYQWNNAVSLRYRIMVAAGGAGSGWASANRPYGGALQSTPAYQNNNIATQTSGNAFGVGGSGTNTATSSGISGGGGGYWGGYKGVASTTTASVGTGGSSFISGYTGAVAVTSASSNSPRYGSDGTTVCANGTTDHTCSIHFSGYEFINDETNSNSTMVMKAGSEEMPSHDGDEDVTTMIGNAGNGYARISIEKYEKDVTYGDEVGTIPSPMLETGEQLIIDGEPVYDEDGEPIYLGEQEINWLDESNNPVYEHTIYSLNRDSIWHADGTRPKEYKITYNLDGGVANNPTHYNQETATFTLERPTKEGYRFDGWTGSNGDTPQKDVTIEEGSAGSKEYTANWTAGSTLTINPNGGTYSGENPRIEPSGTTISVPIPILPGRRFTGWTLRGSSGGNAYGTITNNNPSTTQQTYTYGNGNDTITANWVNRDDITITFNAMGGTSCASKVGSYQAQWSSECITTREGYVFDGWYDKETGGTKICETSCSGTFIDDQTLYAHWIGGTAKVEYDYNINQTFAASTMMDTYFKPDWSKAFEIDISFIPSTSGKNYMLVGNYDTTASNAIYINVAPTNKIAIGSGNSSGTVSQQFGTVVIGEENSLHVSWEPETQMISAELTNSLGTTTFSYLYVQLTGVASRNLRIGALDYRQASTNPFSALTVTNFVISEYYESPLAEEIIVPDPAGYYLLFDGWTGANGDTPQYNVIVPLNSYGTVRYVANWSPGVNRKNYKSGNYSTSNQYIKFYYNVVVAYVDQARRKAYTYERVFFYRTNTGYTTYGTGSMTIKYNGSSYTKSISDSNKITNSGITLWSRYWNSQSNTYDSVSYNANGTKSVTIGITKFSHQRFSISGLPKNYTVTLPAIKSIE